MKFVHLLTQFKNASNLGGVIENLDNNDFIPANIKFSSGSFVVGVWGQRSSDQDDHKRKKSINETCFQVPQNCSWLKTRWNYLDANIQIKYIDVKNQLANILTKWNFFTWRMESSFVFVQHESFQFYRLFWSDVEKNAKRFSWRKNHSKVEFDDEFDLAIQHKGSWHTCLYCIRKSGRNQIWKSITSELVDWVASKNGETSMGRLLIKLLRMECW